MGVMLFESNEYKRSELIYLKKKKRKLKPATDNCFIHGKYHCATHYWDNHAMLEKNGFVETMGSLFVTVCNIVRWCDCVKNRGALLLPKIVISIVNALQAKM